KKKQLLAFNNGDINGVLFNDRRMVLFLSSFHSIDNSDSVNFCTSINHERKMFSIYNYTSTLKTIHDYNCNINGVDVFDQKMENYNTNRKSTRWTFKLSLFIINVFFKQLIHSVYK
ncbi:hypothetical protein CDIK_1229, partial [Cucumispora dikerogammari]